MGKHDMVEIVVRDSGSPFSGGASVTIRYPASLGLDEYRAGPAPRDEHRLFDRHGALIDLANRAMDLLLGPEPIPGEAIVVNVGTLDDGELLQRARDAINNLLDAEDAAAGETPEESSVVSAVDGVVEFDRDDEE